MSSKTKVLFIHIEVMYEDYDGNDLFDVIPSPGRESHSAAKNSFNSFKSSNKMVRVLYQWVH